MISRVYVMIDVASIQAVTVLIGSRMRAGWETGGWVKVLCGLLSL
jgi:uncharacterized membrane protein